LIDAKEITLEKRSSCSSKRVCQATKSPMLLCYNNINSPTHADIVKSFIFFVKHCFSWIVWINKTKISHVNE